MCGAYIKGMGKAQSLVEKTTTGPLYTVSAMGVGFIFQFNGIGSTRLMSHVISYVQMGFSGIKRYEGIVELMTSSHCILP